jgi:hypothetical protein
MGNHLSDPPVAEGRDKTTGRFLPGNKGGPGRKQGARVDLAEIFLREVLADFAEHGKEAIRQAREASPEIYVRMIASLLPKEVEAQVRATGTLEVRDVSARELLAGRIAGIAARGGETSTPGGTDRGSIK